MPESSPVVPAASRVLPARPAGDFEGELTDRALLVLPFLLATLTILLAGAVSCGLILRPLLGPLQLVLLAAILGLTWRVRQARTLRAMVALVGVGLLAAWLALFDWAGHWLHSLGDVALLHPDAWNYASMGDYFKEFPRGHELGLSMIQQYATKFSDSRFASAGFVVFFQQFGALKETPLNHTAFYAVCLVTQFFSLLYLTHTLLGRDRPAFGVGIGAAFAGTAAGWSSDLLGLANYDNLLFISLSPAFIGLLCRWAESATGPSATRPAVWIGLSTVMLAALFYAYPEGFLILLPMVSPLGVAMALGGRRDRRRWGHYGATAGLTLLLVCPYAPTFLRFSRNQFDASRGGGALPAAGTYEGLLDRGRGLPSLFALGEEHPGAPWRMGGFFLGLVLLALVVIGVWEVGRRRPWFAWALVPIAALYFWQAALKGYDYGTFKVLACASWWVYPAAAAGFAVVTRRLGLSGQLRTVVAGALLLAIGHAKFQERRTHQISLAKQMQPARELPGIRFVTGGAPVALNLDSDFDHLWAAYYLRDQPLAAVHQRHYLAYLAGEREGEFLTRGRVPDAGACTFMLVSGGAPNALWHNANFSLVAKTREFLGEVTNPQGVELFQGARLLWLGTRPASFQVVVSAAGNYELRANKFGLGPSLPDKTSASVELDDGHGPRVLAVGADTRALPLRLERGENLVRLRCLDVPEPGLHNGDPRELMLAILGFTLGPPTSPPAGP